MSLAQLHDVGLTTNAVGNRVARGRLHRVHRGVFAVGHPALASDGIWHAALLALGDAAVIGLESSAQAWRMLSPPDRGQPVHVVVRGEYRRPRPGLIIHRARLLHPHDVTTLRGLRITSPARTLLDMAETTTVKTIARAAREAEFLRLLPDGALEATLNRAHGRHGASRLRRALGLTDTRSDMEIDLLDLCEAHHIPPPVVNTIICGHEVDFSWPAHRLIVETDGRQAHLTRYAFEEDRARDAELTVAGWRVVRFTWKQLQRDPARVAATLRSLLSPGATEPPPRGDFP